MTAPPAEAVRSYGLLLVCAAAAAGGFLFGFDQIVISGTVDAVRSQFRLTAGLEGLFVSAALLGAMLGAAVAGRLADRIGRRFNLGLAGLLTLISAIASALAPDPQSLTLARFVGGVGIGVASMICPLYISELAPRRERGRLVTLFQFAITLGILLALVVNAWLAAHIGEIRQSLGLGGLELWRAMLATQALPSLIFLAACARLPESPRWLAAQGRLAEAQATLQRFMPTIAAQDVLAEVAGRRRGGHPLAELLSEQRRPLAVALTLAFMSEMSGITVVFYYGPTILTHAGFALGGALTGIVSIGVVNLLATTIALGLIDRVGRRPLLLVGTSGAVICLLGIAATIGAGAGLGLVALICGFVVFFAFGIGPIKFVVASELFPTATRGPAVALVTVAVWATGAFVNQLFPVVREAWGPAASFLVFAGVLVLQIPFALLILPETAGRSLETLRSDG